MTTHRIGAAAALLFASSLFASGPCPCATDLNNDGMTDAPDLAILLGAWGDTGLSDFDANGTTDAADLAILLGAWGPCEPPPNDNCPQAIVLSGSGTIIEPICNASATDSPGSFPSSCDGDTATIGKDIWYRYTMPYDGALIVHTYDSSFDTVLGVYGNTAPSGCSCPATIFSTAYLIACSDDANGGFNSFVDFPISAGECMAIRVGGYKYMNGDIAEGPGLLTIRPIKRGDRCDIAHELPSQNHVTVDGTNAGDTWVQADLSSCAAGDTIDEWYRFEMPCSGSVTISTCDGVTDFDTTLAVYTGCGGLGDQILCNDDSSQPGCQLQGFNRKSELTVNASGGEVLFIRVSGFQGATGAFRLSLDVSCIN
jgi:hypothetical protein